jgi:hypothetical protein
VARTPAKPRKRVKQRRLYEAKAVVEGNLVWIVAKGATRTVIDSLGNVTSQRFEPCARLWSNIGDSLVVCGPTLEENAFGRVIAVKSDGALKVLLTIGAIAACTTKVRVMRARSAA